MDFGLFFRRFFSDRDDFDRDFHPESDDNQRNIMRDNVIDDSSEMFDSPTDMFNLHTDMFHQMEDMFNRMFSFPFGIIGFSNFRDHIPDEHKSPRHSMLKDSDEEASSSSNMKSFEEPVLPFSPGKGFFEKSHSFSKFSSIKTVRLPDGTVEEHRTVIDSDGKKTTKIRRSINGTSHEVVTKSDSQGIKEKEENFTNMDESELPDFEQKWSGLRSKPAEETETSPSLGLPPSSPTYLYLLKKYFGSSKKGEIESC